MSIVTVPEFQNYLSGVKLTDIQSLDAQNILDGVQSELETYLNRSIQQRRVAEVLDVTGRGTVHVSNSPIAELYGVHTVTGAGTPSEAKIVLPAGGWKPGRNFIRLGWSSCGVGQVYVDYLGGYNGDQIPGLKLAITRVAAREFVHNHSDGMTVQNTELRPPEDPSPVAKGWTIDELAKFDRYRRRVLI